MLGFFDVLVIAQYAVTALSSGFNACYFWGYHSWQKRRRVGAVALTVSSLALFIESSYFGLFAFFREQQWSSSFFLDPHRWFIARLLVCLGSMIISILILRRLTRTKH